MVYTRGTKLYSYSTEKVESGETQVLNTVRILKYDEKNDQYKLKWIEKNEEGNFDRNTIHEQMVRINPDGIVSFNIVRDGPIQDVMILTHPVEDGSVSPTPFAICRQDCIDIFRMATTPTPVEGQVWAGISINKNNCPAEVKLEDFAKCDEIEQTTMIAVYKEDTIDDLLSMIFVDRFDNILKAYEKKHKGDNAVGICTSIKQLMEETNFMYDFHEAMGIIETPFVIDGTPTTNDLIKDIIGQIKHVYVENIYLIPYSREVDTSEFERPWVLMTPDWSKAREEDRKIFIVGYDVDPDKDYLTMKFGTNNKEDILKQMGFRTM